MSKAPRRHLFCLVNVLYFALIPVLISICSQGDPGYGFYTKGAKGDKGLEGPEVRYFIPFIPFAITFKPPLMVAHTYEI